MLHSLSSSLVSLPAAGYLLIWTVMRQRGCCWRAAAINAAVVWGAAVVLISEALSRPRWLTRGGIAITWLAIDLILAIAVWRSQKRERQDHKSEEKIPEISGEKLRGFDKALLSGVGCIMALTLITTLAAPQNPGDVQTYHLPRVVFWIQNRSVDFFATNDGRQIHQPPGAEYGMLHLHLLAGSDRFDGLIQWFGFLLSVVTVSLIAKRFGADRRTQILAAVFCATIPQGIMQATGGKNDYALAFLLAAMVHYLLAFKDEPNVGPNFVRMLGVGASLGLATITKGTAYFFAPPILLAFAGMWPKTVWARAIKLAPVGLAIVLALNLAHWTRNYRLSGSPVGPSAEGLQRELPFGNEVITPSTIFSNIMRNVALHCWTPSEKINHLTEKLIAKVVRAAGADVNDPRTTWHIEVFGIQNRPFQESHTGNTWHFLLLLLALGAVAVKPDLRGSLWAYALAISGAFVLFCAALRWQPWHSRLHIPLFVLSAVPVSMFLSHVKPRLVAPLGGCALLLLAMPWALHNSRRSLLPTSEFNVFRRSRTELLFAARKELLVPYVTAANEIKKTSCAEVGMDFPPGNYEYPLLALLGADQGEMRVRHLDVRLPSKIYAEAESQAASGVATGSQVCAVACLYCPPEKAEQYSAKAKRVLALNELTVFVFKD
jgi:4-amino-4-deoxy-L-arabinose transferase-like glycosyltransferase